MTERVFGIETEYAIVALGPGVSREDVIGRILAAAKSAHPHMNDCHGSGAFFENGARMYVDCGLHLEYATPECSTPWDASRYVQAGERTVLAAARQVEKELGAGVEILCLRSNVDYSPNHSTWGCHESYLHRAEPETLPGDLVPHLVTRVVYTGAGGFHPTAWGLDFSLSPRAAYIQEVVSGNSTAARGIFHTKDEPLAGEGFHRLHVICGESLCSETAVCLKVGATALVLAMAEAGLQPGAAVKLQSPIESLRKIAADPECRAPLRLAAGGEMTALQIQQRYLELAETHLGAPFMPSWAPEVCRRWRAILELLEQGPEAASTLLDWTAKWALYRNHSQRRGLGFGGISAWSRTLETLNAALDKTIHKDESVGVDVVIGPNSPVLQEAASLTCTLRDAGLDWSGLNRFFGVRKEYFEIDTRFGQLGDQGIFHTLDRAGLLAHHVPAVDRIEEALHDPPATTRAGVRGRVIRRLAGENGHWCCDWQGIWGGADHRSLDLSDPLCLEERWTDSPLEGVLSRFGLPREAPSRNRILELLRQRGMP